MVADDRTFEHSDVDVRADGSCFYRALFGALVHDKLLPSALRCLGIGHHALVHALQMNEDSFVRTVRTCMQRMLRDPNERELSIIAHQMELMQEQCVYDVPVTVDEYQEAGRILQLSDWAVPYFSMTHARLHARNVDDFRKECANQVVHADLWAGTLDVGLLNEVFGREGIRIVVWSRYDVFPSRPESGHVYLHMLIREGQGDHYNWVRYEAKTPSRTRIRTMPRRTVRLRSRR